MAWLTGFTVDWVVRGKLLTQGCFFQSRRVNYGLARSPWFFDESMKFYHPVQIALPTYLLLVILISGHKMYDETLLQMFLCSQGYTDLGESYKCLVYNWCFQANMKYLMSYLCKNSRMAWKHTSGFCRYNQCPAPLTGTTLDGKDAVCPVGCFWCFCDWYSKYAKAVSSWKWNFLSAPYMYKCGISVKLGGRKMGKSFQFRGIAKNIVLYM